MVRLVCLAAVLLAALVLAAPGRAQTPTVVERAGVAPDRAAVLVSERIATARGWRFTAVRVVDLDVDGRADVVGLDPERGVLVARALGRNRFQTLRYRGLFGLRGGEQLEVGDVDGDGRPDLVTTGRRRFEEQLRVQVAFGRAGGFETARPSPVVVGAEAARLALGDVDGDRRADAILALTYAAPHRSRRGDGVAVLGGRADRGLTAPRYPTALTGDTNDRSVGPLEMLAADLDGDDRLDLVARGAVVRGLGAGRFDRPVPLAPLSLARDGGSSTRVLVRRVRGFHVVAAARPARDGLSRAGVVGRGVRALRRVRATRLQSPSIAGAFPIPDGAPAPARLQRGRGFDLAYAGGRVLWVAHTADGRVFEAAVPTVVPGGVDVVDAGDLDGDGRDELAGGTDGGLVLVRAARRAPLSRPLLPSTAPLISVDATSYPVLGCSDGAGACVGAVSLSPTGGRSVLVAAGERVLFEVRAAPPLAPRARPTLRWSSPLQGARRVVLLTPPTPGDLARACSPPPGERVLARGSGFAVVRGRTFSNAESSRALVCSTATGGRTDLVGEDETAIIAPVLAGFGSFVATLRDVCPGGFEGCIAGLQVQRVPGLETVTAFVVGDGTEAVAVGQEGALAWVQCPYAEEFDPTCEGGPYVVLRLDARGRRVVGRGAGISPRSLRARPDGRGFTWRDRGRERSAAWSGAPPRTLPDPS